MSILNSTLYGSALYGTDVYDSPESGLNVSASTDFTLNSSIIKTSIISWTSDSDFNINTLIIRSSSTVLSAQSDFLINSLIFKEAIIDLISSSEFLFSSIIEIKQTVQNILVYISSYYSISIQDLKAYISIFKTGEINIESSSDIYVDPFVIYLKYLEAESDTVVQEEFFSQSPVNDAVIFVEDQDISCEADGFIYESIMVESNAIVMQETLIDVLSDGIVLDNLNIFMFGDAIVFETIELSFNSDTVVLTESEISFNADMIIVLNIYNINIDIQADGIIVEQSEVILIADAEIYDETYNYDLIKNIFMYANGYVENSFYDVICDGYVYSEFTNKYDYIYTKIIIIPGEKGGPSIQVLEDVYLSQRSMDAYALIEEIIVINVLANGNVAESSETVINLDSDAIIFEEKEPLKIGFLDINALPGNSILSATNNIKANISYFPLLQYYNGVFYNDANDSKFIGANIDYIVVIIPEVSKTVFCDGFVYPEQGIAVLANAILSESNLQKNVSADANISEQVINVISVKANIANYRAAPKLVTASGYVSAQVVFPVPAQESKKYRI